MTAIDLKSKNLVESIIKRKNGTVIPFGHGHHRRVEYSFQPIDKNAKDSPHVCDVPDDKHRAQLLAIKEGFRLYNQPQEQQNLDEDDQDDDNEKGKQQGTDDGIDYEDLLGVDADQVTTDFLKAYAKDHLKISVSAKAAAIAYAKEHYGLDLDGTATVTTLHRQILKAEQAVQLKASEAAKLANT
ncbi:hypothetical protein [Acinetobacter modestus]|uniref:hypothetical protein n=1 Tax=Acinetobacter modestus TaxID=1776740 RepID=UPI003015DFEE